MENSKIRTFINDNNLSFEEGNRNTSCTTIIGYAQHLGISQDRLKSELIDKIEEDSFIKEEIDRLWNYCLRNNYKNYWDKPEAKKQWKF